MYLVNTKFNVCSLPDKNVNFHSRTGILARPVLYAAIFTLVKTQDGPNLVGPSQLFSIIQGDIK